jgi:hypothetical protein
MSFGPEESMVDLIADLDHGSGGALGCERIQDIGGVATNRIL